MNKKALLSLVMVGTLTLGVVGSYAWFTSKAESKDNNFRTGKLTVGVTSNKNTVGDSQVIALSSVAQPGDIITAGANGQSGPAVIDIVNNGDFNLAYLANFEFTSADKGLSEKIYIYDWKNEVVDSTGKVTEIDHFINNGKDVYGFYTSDQVDTDKNDKVSLAEWVASNNNGMNINNGWDPGAIKPGYTVRNTITLKVDEDANDDFQNKTLGLKYKVLATQANVPALGKLMDNNSIQYFGLYDPITFAKVINDRLALCK
jgi:predicted ribosomally synthesized peptide with SipW-like signal peptide